MRIQHILLLAAASISLAACSTAGNIVPNKGPTMEQIYDGMSKDRTVNQLTVSKTGASLNSDVNSDNADDLNKIRSSMRPIANHAAAISSHVSAIATNQEFRKIPNPELKIYVYPHFAGNDEVPIPGYMTAINAYDHDHYVLPSELAR